MVHSVRPRRRRLCVSTERDSARATDFVWPADHVRIHTYDREVQQRSTAADPPEPTIERTTERRRPAGAPTLSRAAWIP
jgi:hypothetical protein